MSPHQYILTIALALFVTHTFAQTKIAIPPAKIEFSEIGKKRDKKQERKTKIKDKLKEKQVKELGNYLNDNTDLTKEDIEKYKVVLSSMDSAELKGFEEELYQIEELSKAKEHKAKVKTYKKKAKESEDKVKKSRRKIEKIKKDSTSVKQHKEKLKLKNWKKDSLLTRSSPELDSISSLTGTEEYLTETKKYREEFNQLNDSSMMQKVTDTLGVASYKEQYLNEYEWYKDSINNLNPDSLSQNEQIKSKLEQLVKEKYQLQAIEDLEDPTKTVTSPVKQYIPDLEKFDYEKPEIPDEEFIKALAESEKKRRLKELKASVIPANNDTTQQEVYFYDRLIIGGYFEYIPDPGRIDMTPSIAYGFTDKLSFGGGYNFSIPLSNKDSLSRVDGYRLFLDYVFYRSYFFHVESEWLRERDPIAEIPDYHERNTYIGLGKSFGFKFLKTNVLVLYNFNAPSRLNPKPFTFRFGVTYTP